MKVLFDANVVLDVLLKRPGVSQAAMAIDESYTITDPLLIVVHDPAGESGGANTSFVDAAIYEDCTRVTVGSVIQQQPELDTDS